MTTKNTIAYDPTDIRYVPKITNYRLGDRVTHSDYPGIVLTVTAMQMIEPSHPELEALVSNPMQPYIRVTAEAVDVFFRMTIEAHELKFKLVEVAR